MKKRGFAPNITSYFGHNSIFFKYWKHIFIVALLPIFVLTIVSYTILYVNAKNTSTGTTKSEFENSYISFNSVADEFYSKFMLITSNNYVNLFWQIPQENLLDNSAQNVNAKINELISNIKLSSSFIEEINVYSDINKYILSSYNSNKLEWFHDTSWIDEYDADQRDYFIMVTENKYITFVYAAKQAGNTVGLVSMKVDLEQAFKKINMFSQPTVINFYDTESKKYIYDNGINIPINDNELYYKNMDKSQYCAKLTNVPNTMLVCKTQMSHYKYNHILVGSISLCILATIFLSLIISRFVSNDFYKSIADIILQIKENKNGSEDFIQDDDTELEYIQKNFVNLSLDKKLTDSELAQKMASLKLYQTLMLQNQFNPHFLFNSLNAVSSILINSCEDNRPCEIITGICELMTAAYNSKKYIISLEQEIEYTKMYLHIEEIKNNYGFDTEYNIDGSLSQCRVLKFILQPIVENAVFYGIKRLSQYERGIISISAYEENGNLSISVKDNGPGMTPEKIAELYNNMKEEDILKEQHIGLCNVNNRLKLFYGDEYGVKLIESDSDGTLIKISLPIEYI